MVLKTLFKYVLGLFLFVNNPFMIIAQAEDNSSVIVSGFVLNSATAEGVTSNITIKNAETFKIVTIIPTANLSGSYTFRLTKAKYYFIIETPGFEMLNELVDLTPVASKRIQKDLVLYPTGSKKSAKAVELDDPEQSNKVLDPSTEISKKSTEEEPVVNETVAVEATIEESVLEKSSDESTDESVEEESEDEVDIEVVKAGDEKRENGKRVIYGVPISQDGSISEDLQDVAPSANTKIIDDLNEEREARINYTLKDGCQFLDIPMNFPKNDSRTDAIAEQLNLVLSFLKQNPDVKIESRGYSEEGFSSSMQKQVALQRAVNAKKFFIQNGIDPNRVKAVAYPTNELELFVRSKKAYRQKHLVEFRIRGDELFEQEFKRRHQKSYSAYSEELVDDNSTENQDLVVDAFAEKTSSSSNEIPEESTVSDTEDFGGESSLSISSEEAQANTISNEDIVALVTGGNENESYKGEESSKENLTKEAVIDSQNLNSIEQSNERLGINEIELGTEGANYQNNYSDYEREQGSIDGDQIISAIDKINGQIAEIDKKVIFFEPKLAEVDETKYKALLDSVYVFLSTNRRYSIELFGYSSKKGDKKEASILPKNRAQNVAHIFVDKGIVKTRVKFKGGGLYNNRRDASVKVDPEKEMRVTFKILKPDLSGYAKVDKMPKGTGSRPNGRAGANAGNQGAAGGGVSVAKTGNNVEDPYAHLRTDNAHPIPDFKTEQEYIDYLKANQGEGSVEGLFFRVQVGAYKLPLDPKDKLFKSVKDIKLLEGKDGWYRYVTTKYVNINQAYEELKKIKKKVDDAFVLAFFHDQKISMKEATQKLASAK